MRILLVVFCAALLAACSTTESPELPTAVDAPASVPGVDTGGVGEEETDGRRFMGNFRDSVKDHMNDCLYGWSISANAVARRTRSDWDHFRGFFR
jgi:hypothetical protein